MISKPLEIQAFTDSFSSAMGVDTLANLLMLAVATIALLYNARSFNIQSKSTEFASYLAMRQWFSESWRRYLIAKDEPTKKFELGEILNHVEGSCRLYNKGRLPGVTKVMVREYLLEIIPVLFTNVVVASFISKSIITPDTYRHIFEFARRNGLRLPPLASTQTSPDP